MYDSRLGRWLSVDPMKQKYPFFSPYSAFGNNPNYYIDPGGETLRVGGHVEQAKKDILSFVPKKYQTAISFEGGANEIFIIEGKVQLGSQSTVPYTVVLNMTKEQAMATNDPGIVALYEMTNDSKEMYYGAQNTVEVGDFNGNKGIVMDNTDGITGAKVTPRAFNTDRSAGGSLKSLDGVDGLRTIATNGVWTESTIDGPKQKSRASLVFHELYEMNQEVVHNEYYNQNDKYGNPVKQANGTVNGVAMQLNTNGSHKKAIAAEKSLSNGDPRKSESPGAVDKFERK